MTEALAGEKQKENAGGQLLRLQVSYGNAMIASARSWRTRNRLNLQACA